MSGKYKVKSKVEWSWLGNTIYGVVEEVYVKSITKLIKGKKITRHGSPDKPAYLVKSEADNIALKLESELRKQNPQNKKLKGLENRLKL